jgi:4-amino-4-deoxy-L-arabinose transferase-like glycosyltransferase
MEKEKRRIKIKKLDFAIVLFLTFFSASFFLYFYKGPSAFGDDLAYVGVAYDVYEGKFRESNYIFSHRFLVAFPIALFYYILGPSDFSSSLWSLTCAVLTTILTYFIGSLLLNKKAGFLSALLFIFFPLVGMLATACGDNIPMEFFAALSVFFFLWGRKEKDEQRKNLKYFASGLFLFCGLLTTPEFFVMFFFFGVYAILSYALNKKTKISLSTFSFVFGVVFGYLIVAVYELITLGDPFFFFKSQLQFYSTIGKIENEAYVGIPGATQDPNFYIMVMFPYIFNLNSLDGFFNSFLNNLTNGSNNYVGFYFYFFVIASFILILLKERRSYLMILWAVSTIGYLEFGTMSFPKYVFMHRLERFLLIAVVPVCVTIGIFLERLLEFKNPAKYFLVVICLFILIYPSIPINIHWYKINYYVKYDFMNVAKILNNMSNVVVYSSSGYIEFLKLFTNFRKDINYIAFDFVKNCSEIKNGYVIVPISIYGLPERSPCTSWAYGDLQQKCGFKLIQSSQIYEIAQRNKEMEFFNPSFAVSIYQAT